MGIFQSFLLYVGGANRSCRLLRSFQKLLEKINQCEHLIALSNNTKDTILEIEKLLLPLKPRAASLLIETKGGDVIATMTLEDFFDLLDIGKRIEINDRFQKTSPLTKDISSSIDKEIQEFLNDLGDE